MRKVRACEEREGEGRRVVGGSIPLGEAAGGGEGIRFVQIEGAQHTFTL